MGPGHAGRGAGRSTHGGGSPTRWHIPAGGGNHRNPRLQHKEGEGLALELVNEPGASEAKRRYLTHTQQVSGTSVPGIGRAEDGSPGRHGRRAIKPEHKSFRLQDMYSPLPAPAEDAVREKRVAAQQNKPEWSWVVDPLPAPQESRRVESLEGRAYRRGRVHAMGCYFPNGAHGAVLPAKSEELPPAENRTRKKKTKKRKKSVADKPAAAPAPPVSRQQPEAAAGPQGDGKVRHGRRAGAERPFKPASHFP
ncbi:unnamed protein product [Pedinophyceae sp. YPF-701]|nr:unnamed protein product [Pedinophyceae sp. YPF-701]